MKRRTHNRNHLAFAAAAILAPFVTVAQPAQADVSNIASCRLTVHIEMSAGSYRSDSSTVSCSGTLAGQVLRDGGSIDTWGHYVQVSADSGCSISWRDDVFALRVRDVAFFDDGEISADGGYGLDSGPAMRLQGSGQADWQPFTETGIATFTPDPGQTCGQITSGTFDQHVALTDGGDGNPGADAQATRYQRAEYGSSAGSSSPNSKPRARSGRDKHHRKRHRRHRRR